MNTRQYLLRILEIIEYRGDKEKYVANFIKNINEKTIVNLIETLPQEKREKIQTVINTQNNNDLILKQFFSEEEITKAYEETLAQTLTDYVYSISSSLSDAQQKEILDFARSITPTNK